jgi:hypothetical protein
MPPMQPGINGSVSFTSAGNGSKASYPDPLTKLQHALEGKPHLAWALARHWNRQILTLVTFHAPRQGS